MVASQLKSHIKNFNLDNPLQSAYKSFHSTETALLTIQNDIYAAMETGKVTALTLLDLSAAFDTMDHDLLLNRLSEWFGVEGNALKWITSYLKNRFQSVSIQGSSSNPIELLFGVPQGSVLGPLLFIMYTTPLSTVLAKSKDISHHLYADDTQVYNSFNTSTCDSSIKNLQNSLVSAQDWMFQNKLKLNPDKTEFVLIGNKSQRQKFTSKFPISILGNQLTPTPLAKNLGVTLDSDFNFQRQINNTVSSCYYHIRDFRRIRKHLTRDAAISVANALVGSRLDYCNSLLYNAPVVWLSKLQRVQNTLARIVTRSSRNTSISPVLKDLHWLPIRSRISFKIGLIVYKALKFNSPPSLRCLLSLRSLSANIRSVTPTTLNLGSFAKSYGTKAFSNYAPKLWNDIPEKIRCFTSVMSFRKKLKTLFFKNPPKPP